MKNSDQKSEILRLAAGCKTRFIKAKIQESFDKKKVELLTLQKIKCILGKLKTKQVPEINAMKTDIYLKVG